MENDENVFKQISRSGFPFQLRVEEEISKFFHKHGWSIESHEHPWVNPDTGTSGFIDIILRHTQFTTFRIAIECKRMKSKDVRQLQWLFLCPNNPETTQKATCLQAIGKNKEGDWTDYRVWEDVLVKPASLESEFCVLPNDEQKKQPILESLAADVLESIEGLVEEEVHINKSQQEYARMRIFAFPVIVTNAEIIACSFSPCDVNIKDGTIDLSSMDISKLPFIRFRKSLDHSYPATVLYDLKSAQKARERTVFVVNASCILDFLSGWIVNPLQIGGYAISRHDSLM